MSIRVFLISDSTLFATAMEQTLKAIFPHVEKSPSLSHLAQMVKDWQRVVVIVDAGNPREIVSQLLSYGRTIDMCRIVVLMRSNQTIEEYSSVVGTVGAILPDGATLEEISLVARVVRQGMVLLPSSAFSHLLEPATPSANMSVEEDARSFTDREQDVLALISEGASNKIIGRKLAITDSTVRVHMRSILKKLGLQNRTQAALYAVGRKVPEKPASAFHSVVQCLYCAVAVSWFGTRSSIADLSMAIAL